MSNAHTTEESSRKSLRLWPGVVAALLLVLMRFVVPLVVPGTAMVGILGGAIAALAIIVWWLFFSRAAWSERLGFIALMIVALVATSRVVHESISNGMMGMMLYMLGIPMLSVALVAAVTASRQLSSGARRALTVAAILVTCGAFTLIRTGGLTGEGDSDLHWRWTLSPEERLLAQSSDKSFDSAEGKPFDSAQGKPFDSAQGKQDAVAPLPPAPTAAETPQEPRATKAEDKPDSPRADAAPAPSAPVTPKTARGESVVRADEEEAAPTPADTTLKRPAEWPGFRGRERDGVIRGLAIETDWSQSPPVELWRRPIGPGWSSFAIDGDFLYTQEQRGDDEIVASYKVSTGEPVWRHRDPVRFWESNGGAGPRGTPTLSDGRVYAFGATGILNALDAKTGAVVWSRNVASDTGRSVPDWGFASSPLVVDDVVIVAASGQLAAYDVATGQQRWLGPSGGAGYSSPHLVTIDGVPQIMLLRGSRTISVAPADGTLLWEHATGQPSVSIVQPARAANGDLLITLADSMGGAGILRMSVAHGPGGWTLDERWTSRGLKPYFNDFVVHKGHAFGFDGSILACIDLEDGNRKWKGGRYGNGQLVLLPEQDVLLVLSEDGELALVAATTDQFKEIARIPAIQGKTWNHPALVGDVLLVRNGEEMAAFRLPRASH